MPAVASQVYHNNTEQFNVTMVKEIHKMHTCMVTQKQMALSSVPMALLREMMGASTSRMLFRIRVSRN
jgi:hypothetical protein